LFVATVQANIMIDGLLVLMTGILVALYMTVVRSAQASNGPAVTFAFHDVDEPEMYRLHRLEAQKDQSVSSYDGGDDSLSSAAPLPQGSTMGWSGGASELASAEDTTLVHKEALEELPTST
jgi:hypothetical protein